MLRFISKLHSVNMSPGPWGGGGGQTLFYWLFRKFYLSWNLQALGSQKALFVVCSDNVWGLIVPADKENSRWVLSNHSLHAHAKACSFIYVSHRRESWLSLSCNVFGSYISSLSRHQRSLSALCCRLIVLFSVSMQSLCLFSEPANIGAAKLRR